MPRVIAGSVGGRRFRAPEGKDTRPTADRVREALFSALMPELADATVLDLYAGSGALAIEALSRGAARAVLVEADRKTAAVAARNLEELGLDGGQVVVDDVRAFCRAPTGGPFDVVLADPPYDLALSEYAAAVGDLVDRGAVRAHAPIVVERRHSDPALVRPAGADPSRVRDDLVPDGVAAQRVRAYGDTALVWWRVTDDLAGGDNVTVKERS